METLVSIPRTPYGGSFSVQMNVRAGLVLECLFSLSLCQERQPLLLKRLVALSVDGFKDFYCNVVLFELFLHLNSAVSRVAFSQK